VITQRQRASEHSLGDKADYFAKITAFVAKLLLGFLNKDMIYEAVTELMTHSKLTFISKCL
jgi:hypothetical protein